MTLRMDDKLLEDDLHRKPQHANIFAANLIFVIFEVLNFNGGTFKSGTLFRKPFLGEKVEVFVEDDAC